MSEQEQRTAFIPTIDQIRERCEIKGSPITAARPANAIKGEWLVPERGESQHFATPWVVSTEVNQEYSVFIKESSDDECRREQKATRMLLPDMSYEILSASNGLLVTKTIEGFTPLSSMLKQSAKISKGLISDILSQIAEMHIRGVYHLDLAPKNIGIVVKERFTNQTTRGIKIIDFENSVFEDEEITPLSEQMQESLRNTFIRGDLLKFLREVDISKSFNGEHKIDEKTHELVDMIKVFYQKSKLNISEDFYKVLYHDLLENHRLKYMGT